METRNFTRREAIARGTTAAMATSSLGFVASCVTTTPSDSDKPPVSPMAKVEPYVHPRMIWSSVELNEFLAELPPEGLLSMKKALELLPPEADSTVLKGADLDVEEIKSRLLWVSTNVLAYPLRNSNEIHYHELVRWVARESGVDAWIVDTQPTFVIERALQEQLLSHIWDKLNTAQRVELLTKIDTHNKITDKAAVAMLSGSGAAAALALTVYFAGFTFYTTMSVIICTVAAWFGVTLPFVAYMVASSIVAFLAGPIGWAIAAVLAAAGIAFAGRANFKKTAAAICQIHALKVAALQTARHSSESVFQPLGSPIRRQLIGKWSWNTGRGRIDFDLLSDGTFTAKDYPEQKPTLSEGGGLVKEGKGTWRVRDGRLTVEMTHVWALAFWKEHRILWIADQEIVGVSETEVRLKAGPPLQRR